MSTTQYKVVHSPLLYPETNETKSGVKILDTHVNLEWLLRHFNATVKNNLMKRQWEVSIPNHELFNEDHENSAIERIEYLAILNGMPDRKIAQHIKTIAEANSYHPIVEMLTHTPWDGTRRLDQFIDTIDAENQPLTRIIIKTWMVCAVAAIFAPKGFVCHGVLVLQGSQKQGKTGWIKSLDPLNCGAVKEGAHLDPTNKDDVMSAMKHWIVELGELDSTFKKDIARLKSFITASSDQVRVPYARKSATYYRRTVFAASVNHESYLVDETGNRRWWTVAVKKIHFNHGLDMQQVWAEVYHLFRQGHPTDLSENDQFLVNINNEKFQKIDPLEEALMNFYDWTCVPDRRVTSTDILREINWPVHDKSASTRIGGILLRLNGGQKSFKSNGARYTKVPPIR